MQLAKSVTASALAYSQPTDRLLKCVACQSRALLTLPDQKYRFSRVRMSGSRSETVTSVSEDIQNVRINRIQPVSTTSAPVSRQVWVWTASKEVMTAALEAGWDTFLVEGGEAEANEMSSLARLNLLIIDGSSVKDYYSGKEVANFFEIRTGFDLEEMTRLRGQQLPVIMDSKNWKLIPAENVVAAFQGSATPVFATAKNAAEARDAFEALERGTDGVVLRTESLEDVFSLKEYLQTRVKDVVMPLSTAVVTRVQSSGMGDRVCVDLCTLLKPGEGLLVGSFARCLFLVHSECLSADYVASRPFRVNAGPVCAYTAVPGGRTAYLSELRSGSEVVVADSQGRCHVAVVGRAKVERRPMVMVEVEVETEEGCGPAARHSLLLQNAETVRLVTPEYSFGGGRPISVSEIEVGDLLLVALQQSAARHTGIAIEESIVER